FFDARVAQREERMENSHAHATEAIKRFRELRWEGYAESAHTLLPGKTVYQVRKAEDGIASGMKPMLTSREQQVAQLVLHGLTNRAIAAQLNISENTVESHMSGIMGRLGVRSRHQLSQTLSEGRDEL